MARVTFVKSARKDNPVAKKGESYYWWKPMVGGRGGAKRYSKERPSRSQLTQSEFLSTVYSICDDQIDNATCAEDFREAAQAIRDLGEETQGKYDNMPEGLQQGDTGQMLEERANECESWADELETIADNLGDEPDETEEAEEPEEGEESDEIEDDWETRLNAAREEAGGACPF